MPHGGAEVCWCQGTSIPTDPQGANMTLSIEAPSLADLLDLTGRTAVVTGGAVTGAQIVVDGGVPLS
jgi:hypothetical protein